MWKTLLAATAALTLMSGAGFAQMSSSSTSTTVVTPGVPARHDLNESTTVTKTKDKTGVTVDTVTEGSETIVPGVPATSRTTTQTTTVR